MTALRDYHSSIDDQASTSWVKHPLQKLKKRKEVKRKERAARNANEGLRICEDSVSSCGSDISSIYAASGSPPESREAINKVDDWRADIKVDIIEEDWKDYVDGEYLPVRIGDEFSDGRYVVVRQLGWNHFSTSWLTKDTKLGRHVALEVVNSAPRYTEIAFDEIKMLQRLKPSSPPVAPKLDNLNSLCWLAQDHPGRSHVISLLDHFEHKGPNDTHVCMVFEVFGENLLGLIKHRQSNGVPMHVVRQIAKQVLLGLDYVHRCCGVIHTGIYLTPPFSNTINPQAIL